jgi:hypothetical protein
MLTYYAMEVIIKDRLREHRKAALREAYGDQSKRVSFYQRQWCRLRRFLAGFWLPREISFMRLELPPSLDLCAGTI